MKNLLQRAAQNETASAELREKIRAGIRANQSPGIFSRTATRFALAACALIALSIGVWYASRSWNRALIVDATQQAQTADFTGNQMREILDIGLNDHIHCALDNSIDKEFFKFEELPSAVSTKFGELISAANNHLGSDYDVAAHHCEVNNREFIHVIFKRDDALLSIVLTEKKGESLGDAAPVAALDATGKALYRERSHNLEVVGFETPSHFAFVISNLSESDNLRIAAGLVTSTRAFLSKLEATA